MKMFFCAHRALVPFLYLLIYSVTNTVFAANIQVKIDRNPVNIQESFQLIFTADGDPDDDPDFSPLKNDFDILNQAKEQSTQIINWKRSKRIQWTLTVMAKRTGSLVVPAIYFGKDNSLITAVVVTDTPQQSIANNNEDLFLQTSVDTEMPYIQEQVIYTLKLFSKVNMTQATITEPVLNDAVIVRLGEDKTYNTQHKGDNYVVVEREYAIFPQKSGAMTIEPLTLTTSIVVSNNRRYNSFFSQQTTRNKRVVSKSIELNVQAKPINNRGSTWLPAEQVYIEEKWSIDPQEITLGEPVTRTISLFVKGVTVSILPELQKQKLPKQIKAYPDQPILKESPQGRTLVSFREEKIALIASEVGTYTLPAIEIPWWNTKTQTQEMAVIVEKQFVVIAGELNNNKALQQEISILNPAEVAMEPVGIKQENNLWFILTLFFGNAWLLTLLYLLLNRNSKNKIIQPQKIQKKAVSSIKQLKLACAKNDSNQAKQVLLDWGREAFQKNSLEAIAQECHNPLKEEIQRLNIVLYSKALENWQGDALLDAFQQHESLVIDTKKTEDGLPPLFKI